ncbi:MAG: ATP synthase subunit I [Longimicrobiales bacterium]|nr:ATP synthase subunit I [Longimicrobiales bacterium]
MVTEVVGGLLAGGTLGGLYFGALWLTVRRIPHASRPGLLVAVSYLVRLAALAGGFYVVVRLGGGTALVAGLVGLLAARQLLVGSVGKELDIVPKLAAGPFGEKS